MNSAQFSSLITLSFFEDKKYKWIGLLITILFPYVLSICRKIWSKIVSWYYAARVSITLRLNQNKDGVPLSNFSYKAMCWYCIEKHCHLQKSLLCESDTIKKNEKIGNTNIYKKSLSIIPTIHSIYNTQEF